LGITQPSVSDSRRRGVFPSKWSVQLAREYNLDTEYILSGEQLKGYEHSRKEPLSYDEKKTL